MIACRVIRRSVEALMEPDAQEASSGRPSWKGTGFLTMTVVALFAAVASTELHETFHLVVGRLAGLPAHFLALTSAGVTPSVAEHASPAALALMNGVAPIATMILGVVALVAAPRLRGKAPAAVTDFIAWCAIFAIPYIGLQTMVTAAPVDTRGSGADFAAVLGGYFGVSLVPRTIVSLAGFVIFIASGFWLRKVVSERREALQPSATLGGRLRAVATWRVVAALVLGLVLTAMTVRSFVLLVNGNSRGLALLVRGIVVWAAMVALLVRWQEPGARGVRDHWLFPGLAASACLIATGLLSHLGDYFLVGLLLALPLVTTAWSESAAGETEAR